MKLRSAPDQPIHQNVRVKVQGDGDRHSVTNHRPDLPKELAVAILIGLRHHGTMQSNKYAVKGPASFSRRRHSPVIS